MSSLVDVFASGAPGPNWVVNGSCPIQQKNGEVLMPLADQTQDFCWYATASYYHLTCDSLTIKVNEATSPVVGVQTYIYLRPPASGAESLFLLAEGGGWSLQGDSGSGPIKIKKAYDPALDVWWKLREAAGILHFETSPDGKAWTELGSGPDPINLDAVQIVFGVGEYAPVTNPGQGRFACYNKSAPCP